MTIILNKEETLSNSIRQKSNYREIELKKKLKYRYWITKSSQDSGKARAALSNGIKIDTFRRRFFFFSFRSLYETTRVNVRHPSAIIEWQPRSRGKTRETNDFIRDCSSRRANVPFVSLCDRWNARLSANRPRNPVLQRDVISFGAVRSRENARERQRSTRLRCFARDLST